MKARQARQHPNAHPHAHAPYHAHGADAHACAHGGCAEASQRADRASARRAAEALHHVHLLLHHLQLQLPLRQRRCLQVRLLLLHGRLRLHLRRDSSGDASWRVRVSGCSGSRHGRLQRRTTHRRLRAVADAGCAGEARGPGVAVRAVHRARGCGGGGGRGGC